MKLFYSPGTCALVPHILLEDTGTAVDLVRVDTKTHKTEDGGDFYAINPKGYVPVLELDDGERLTEGPVIAQYLADKAGREDLMPAGGTMARYRVIEWQNYITSELHKSYTPLFKPDFDATAKQMHTKLLLAKLAWVSAQLAEREFLTGSTFTAADAYLFVVVSWSKIVKVDLSGLEPLQQFMQRVAARPAVRAAMLAEGLKA